MENKSESVKVTVNKEEEKKPTKKRGRPRKKAQTAPKREASKKPAKKTSIAEARAKSATTKKDVDTKASKSGKKKGGIMHVIMSIIVTSLVVGAVIYAWQSRTGEEMVNNVRQEARNTRMDFEQRLEQLKNKITGIENENQSLMNTKKELEEKAKLLEGAEKDFRDPETGIEFEYPAVFGDIMFTMVEGESGKKFSGTFSKNEKIKFGGVSEDYVPKATSTDIEFLETSGFYENRDRYYYQPIGEDNLRDYELIPTKIIGTEDREILVIDQKSFVIDEDADGASINIGQNIGAVLNLESENYPGLAFLNEDLGAMPMIDFEAMLNSVE